MLVIHTYTVQQRYMGDNYILGRDFETHSQEGSDQDVPQGVQGLPNQSQMTLLCNISENLKQNVA
jgi:hypothetical protein